MNRRHTGAEYLALIERMRGVRADLALSSDFIVGFPGETEDDFGATLDLIEDVGFAGAFSFKYSPRPGTPAATMVAQVPEPVKTERLHRLQAAIERHQARFNASCVGKTFDVLFEKAGKRPGQIVGRSPWLQPVHVMAPSSLIGEVVSVTVDAVRTNSLFGTLNASADHAAADRTRVSEHSCIRNSCARGGLNHCERSVPMTPSQPTPRSATPRRSWSPSTTIALPRCCSANTGRTSH